MPQVKCIVESTSTKSEGRWVDSVQATCMECGNVNSSFGRGTKSVTRCLVMMRETCPRGETDNRYIKGW